MNQLYNGAFFTLGSILMVLLLAYVLDLFKIAPSLDASGAVTTQGGVEGLNVQSASSGGCGCGGEALL